MPRVPATDRMAILKRNLDAVKERIAAACARCGRNANEILLVAVTKYVDAETAKALFDFGCHDLAESRPQELWKKAEAVPDARWHLVGHLQSNKVRRTLPLVSLIHSIDRWELAEEISKEAEKQKLNVRGLIEVKLTKEEAKHGFAADVVRRQWNDLRTLPGLTIDGLMGMAALDADEAGCHAAFQTLRTLRDELATTDDPLPVLSMGMSGDLEIAIEEGATHVRIGSALFEGLDDAGPTP
jgi:pyridoxal phosphate enzyme (YggS family)